MAKPSRSDCNPGYAGCFYLEKEAMYPGKRERRMQDDVVVA
ncbi:hypothetical protein [Cupriavidus sp. CP313]